MVSNNYIRLSQWAAQHGMHRMTAWRHYNDGTLNSSYPSYMPLHTIFEAVGNSSTALKPASPLS